MKNEAVLVTGATRGLGLAIARRLLDDGYGVAGVGRTCSAEYAELVARVGPGKALFFPYDLSQLDGIQDLVGRISASFGNIYGLVNNAGIGLDGVLATMHSQDIDRLITVNLTAPIHLIKYASRQMMLKRRGRIVNISSIIARTGFSGLSVYAATKAGLEGLTHSLSRELGKIGINVNCVAPGYLETEMTQGLQGDKLEMVRRRSPLGLARVADVAGAVAYLLGPDGDRVTGTCLTVDGGSVA